MAAPTTKTIGEAAAAVTHAVDTVVAAVTAPPTAERRTEPPSLPPRTTAQEDLTTAGQRRINLIWEYTQAAIALVVVVTSMLAGTVISFTGSTMQLPTIMSVAFGTVVGFYFSRTNHAAIGGVGNQPPPSKYVGR